MVCGGSGGSGNGLLYLSRAAALQMSDEAAARARSLCTTAAAAARAAAQARRLRGQPEVQDSAAEEEGVCGGGDGCGERGPAQAACAGDSSPPTPRLRVRFICHS